MNSTGMSQTVAILWLLFFFFAFVPSLYSGQQFGNITLQSGSVLLVGSDLNATCRMGSSFPSRCSNNDLTWVLNDKVLNNYSVKRSDVKELGLMLPGPHVPKGRFLLKCKLYCTYVGSKVLHGKTIDVGYPPDIPQNLSCVLHISGDEMECHWNKGRPPFISTVFILHAARKSEVLRTCQGEEHCTLKMKGHPDIIKQLTLWVEAKNDLGTVCSENITIDPYKAVIPPAPTITNVLSDPRNSDQLTVLWNTFLFSDKDWFRDEKLDIELWYRQQGGSWIEVKDVQDNGVCSLYGLTANSAYSIRLRSRPLHSIWGHWSQWSEEFERLTSEAPPLTAPDLWRMFGRADSYGGRNITILWKPPARDKTRGLVLGYMLKWNDGVERVKNFTSERRKHTIMVHDRGAPTIVNITTWNSAGFSPKASLKLRKPQPFSGVSSFQVKSPGDLGDHVISLTWETLGQPSYHPSRFVVAWSESCDGSSADFHWLLVPGSQTHVNITDGIEPLTCYNVSLHPLYENLEGLPSSLLAYSREDVPEVPPRELKVNQSKHTASLSWIPPPISARRGLILHYKISWSSERGQKNYANTTKTSYELQNLKPSTRYMVEVSAVTRKGASRPSMYDFDTSTFDPGEVEIIIVSICFCLLFFIIFLVYVQMNLKRRFREAFWPKVPDPNHSKVLRGFDLMKVGSCSSLIFLYR
uniref:Fibronectin type-III domain-containing protein n=1 Tax=Eptatretus burgeri TaxID=7764 RepID=A0A8C4Q4H0_EPTBU